MEIYIAAGVAGLIVLIIGAVVLARSSQRRPASFEENMLGDAADGSARRESQGIHASGRRDDVAASAVAPRSIAREATFRILVVLSRSRDIARLSKQRAQEAGASSSRPQKLGEKVRRGSVLDVVLTGASLKTPQIVQLRWEGRPLEASFQLKLPADFAEIAALFDASIFLGKLCLGVIPLSIGVGAGQAVGDNLNNRMIPPKRIFVSYSSPDRDLALVVARAYDRIGIETFMDRLSLEGGELWEERLAAEIDRCDTVYLLWSQASADSTYVRWEIKRALDRRLADPARRPLIITHIVGTPPPAPPPAELSALQFNDPALALWEQSIQKAKQDEANRRAQN